MSPQAGNEDGDRDSQAPPGPFVCHSVSGGCTVCCSLLGSRFWGCWGWHPGLAGRAVMARLWLSHDPAGPWVPGWLLPPAVGVGTSAGLFPGSLCKQVSG